MKFWTKDTPIQLEDKKWMFISSLIVQVLKLWQTYSCFFVHVGSQPLIWEKMCLVCIKLLRFLPSRTHYTAKMYWRKSPRLMESKEGWILKLNLFQRSVTFHVSRWTFRAFSRSAWTQRKKWIVAVASCRGRGQLTFDSSWTRCDRNWTSSALQAERIQPSIALLDCCAELRCTPC